MLRLICSALILLLAFSAFADDQEVGSSGPGSFENTSFQSFIPSEEGGRVGGDTIESAFPVEALPFNDFGNTILFTNEYNDICEVGSNDAPDVVYSFAPASDMLIDIDLCNSIFANQLFVYEDEYISGDPYACVPGYYYGVSTCESFSARMAGLPVYSGHTYYIIIDGYEGSQGAYAIDIREMLPCDVTPSSDAVLEGEPPLHNDYVDQYNTGCNYDPPILQRVDYLQPDTGCVKIAGLSGYLRPNDNFSRDTDWYSVIALGTEITASVEAEVPFSVFINVASCPSYGATSSHVDPCVTGEVSFTTIPGNEYYIFVAPQGLSHWDHELTIMEYEMEICGQEGVVQVERTTWDALKADYR